MEITLDLDEAEVTALRSGGQVPLSLRDKLSDAVHVRDVGWYLLMFDDPSRQRPVWWSGSTWLFDPNDGSSFVEVDSPDSAQRLYLAEEV